MTKKFTERLVELRKLNNLKQTDMSDLLKINTRQYQRYESGDSEPKIDNLIFLSTYFDTSLDYLVGLTDDPKRY